MIKCNELIKHKNSGIEKTTTLLIGLSWYDDNFDEVLFKLQALDRRKKDTIINLICKNLLKYMNINILEHGEK